MASLHVEVQQTQLLSPESDTTTGPSPEPPRVPKTSHPMRKPMILIFWSSLMTTGESSNVDRPVNPEHHLHLAPSPPQQSGAGAASLQIVHRYINLPLHLSLTCEQEPERLALLHQRPSGSLLRPQGASTASVFLHV